MRDNFTIIDNRVVDRIADIGPIAFAVYAKLMRHADQTGECYPSHATIARAIGRNDRTVRTAIAKLVEKGLIKRVRRCRREAARYRVIQDRKPTSGQEPQDRQSVAGQEPQDRQSVAGQEPQDRQFSTIKTGNQLPVEQDPLNKTHLTHKRARCAAFVKPTVEEVAAYCLERKNGIDPEQFIAKYDAIGWVVGKNHTPMKDWRSVVITWEKNERDRKGNSDGRGKQRPTLDVGAIMRQKAAEKGEVYE